MCLMPMGNVWMLVGAAIAGLAVGAGIALVYKLRGKAHRLAAELREEAARRGETLRIEPQYGSFRGAEREFGRVRCDGIACLTDRRLILARLLGDRIEIPVERIADVTIEKRFLGQVRFGTLHLVIRTTDGNRIGFFVRDPRRWLEALQPKA